MLVDDLIVLDKRLKKLADLPADKVISPLQIEDLEGENTLEFGYPITEPGENHHRFTDDFSDLNLENLVIDADGNLILEKKADGLYFDGNAYVDIPTTVSSQMENNTGLTYNCEHRRGAAGLSYLFHATIWGPTLTKFAVFFTSANKLAVVVMPDTSEDSVSFTSSSTFGVTGDLLTIVVEVNVTAKTIKAWVNAEIEIDASGIDWDVDVFSDEAGGACRIGSRGDGAYKINGYLTKTLLMGVPSNIANWQMDEGEGDTIADGFNNGNDGTIVDAEWYTEYEEEGHADLPELSGDTINRLAKYDSVLDADLDGQTVKLETLWDGAWVEAATLKHALDLVNKTIESRIKLEGGSATPTVYSLLESIISASKSAQLEGGNLVVLNQTPYSISNSQLAAAETKQKTAFCEHLFYELADGQPKDYDLVNTTPSDALDEALADTRWQTGTVDAALESEEKDIIAKAQNPLQAIRLIESTWEARLTFSTVLDGDGGIAGFQVNLEEIDEDFSGQRFEFGKNLRGITINTDSKGLKTALKGEGQGIDIDPDTKEPDVLTFTDVDGDTLGIPKPPGQDWVGDDKAKELYGIYKDGDMTHRFGKAHDTEAETAEDLLTRTWNKLMEVNHPRVTIEAPVADLAKAKIVDIATGELVKLDHEKLEIGNVAYAIARHKGLLAAVKAKIIRAERWLKNPSETTVVFGDAIRFDADLIASLQRESQKTDTRRAIHDRPDVLRLVRPDGVLSVFQYISVGTSYPYEVWPIDGWSEVGWVGINGAYLKGKCRVTVPIPERFVITKATLTIEAMPVKEDDLENGHDWKQSKELKLFKCPGDKGFYYYPIPSGETWIVWWEQTDITNDVLGSSSWSPSIVTDTVNSTEVGFVQSNSGSIIDHLEAGEETTFNVETGGDFDADSFGLARIVVVVEGYMVPE